MDMTNLEGWVGRTQTSRAKMTVNHVDAFHATLHAENIAAACAGQVAPPLCHWTLFPPRVGMEGLGRDGHPKLGDFLPPLDLPRRMWAGGEVFFHTPIRIGDEVEKISTLSAITHKSGTAGKMVFVTVDHQCVTQNGLAVKERQDIVYLPMPERFQPPAPVMAPEAPDALEAFAISETRLFRYSAITFNAHRIHYDLLYAQGVEKLPGLVVHGPLQATALMDFAVRLQGKAPTRLRYRSIHPMFHTEDLKLVATWETPTQLALCTAAQESGHIGMQATAFWEDTP